MARWQDIEESAPEFAAAFRARVESHKHKLLATLRADGSPRLSGIETSLAGGELWLGMMPESRKALDLRRDPRLALHTSSPDAPEGDPVAWVGDAKLSGRAEEVTDAARLAPVLEVMGVGQEGGPPGAWVFRVDIDEAVLLGIGATGDHMLIRLWRDGELREFRRA